MEVGDWRILRSSGVQVSMESGDEGDIVVLEGDRMCHQESKDGRYKLAVSPKNA
jgi:hypothetical protein